MWHVACGWWKHPCQSQGNAILKMASKGNGCFKNLPLPPFLYAMERLLGMDFDRKGPLILVWYRDFT
jgi:hypothetical protein